jgi:hypothetical protein
MSHNKQTVLLRNLLKRKTVHQGGLAIHRKARKELKNIRNIDAFSAVQSASAVKPTGAGRLVERLSPLPTACRRRSIRHVHTTTQQRDFQQ